MLENLSQLPIWTPGKGLTGEARTVQHLTKKLSKHGINTEEFQYYQILDWHLHRYCTLSHSVLYLSHFFSPFTYTMNSTTISADQGLAACESFCMLASIFTVSARDLSRQLGSICTAFTWHGSLCRLRVSARRLHYMADSVLRTAFAQHLGFSVSSQMTASVQLQFLHYTPGAQLRIYCWQVFISGVYTWTQTHTCAHALTHTFTHMLTTFSLFPSHIIIFSVR